MTKASIRELIKRVTIRDQKLKESFNIPPIGDQIEPGQIWTNNVEGCAPVIVTGVGGQNIKVATRSTEIVQVAPLWTCELISSNSDLTPWVVNGETFVMGCNPLMYESLVMVFNIRPTLANCLQEYIGMIRTDPMNTLQSMKTNFPNIAVNEDSGYQQWKKQRLQEAEELSLPVNAIL